MPATPSKPASHSKTLWINGLTTAAGVLTAVTGVIPPVALPYVVIVTGIVNFALRFLTTQPITGGAQPPVSP